MGLLIEDHGLIGDCHTAALVAKDGTIDWLCVPRFDSGACFASLLGNEEHGHWRIAPAGQLTGSSRRYRSETLVLETDFETPEGAVRVIDFMPPRHQHHPRVIRIVEGLRGRVKVHLDLVIRFEYGSDIPWCHRGEDGLEGIAGPNGVVLSTPAPLRGHHLQTVADFEVGEGERVPFVFGWYVAHEEPPSAVDAEQALAETEAFWRDWCAGVEEVHGEWQDEVLRSLMTLKALTYEPTGGIVAAPTTSLPEAIGGVRNWDYRYCWVRDATLTLDALIEAGRRSEAESWLWWLARACAGAPEQLQIMYGPAGERRLTEIEIPWLPGYEGSKPVRVGNAASEQFQLDVYGELMDATDRARTHGIATHPELWKVQLAILDFVASHWQDPDDGIWEMRGPRRHFTHSRVMAWVAMDRGVRAVERHGLEGPVEEWRKVRQAIHDEVCEQGYNAKRKAFTQYYGADELDASCLMIPLVGFLPPDDPRVVSTVEAIERELLVEGFVRRYQNESGVDGLPGGEGAFLPCSFWLVDCLALIGRHEDARALFNRLLGVANDLGLIAEEYDPAARRQLGNFPQAFSHVGLINAARNLASLAPR